MMLRSIATCIGVAALGGSALAEPAFKATEPRGHGSARLMLVQNDAAPDAATPSSAPTPTLPRDGGANAGPARGGSPPSSDAAKGNTNGAGAPAKPAAKAGTSTPPVAITGTGRNGPSTRPGTASPGSVPQNGNAASIPFGGPQTDVQPAYGSPLRDTGAGTGGTPINGTAPTTLGGPINGTSNAYTSTLPNGAAPNGYISNNQGAAAPASRDTRNNPNGFTQKPLGGAPTTRDQFGTYGGRGGYNAQGVYNGTAAQTGTGNGYGSPYAPAGRPTGGLLSNNVDATGPLRPYIPQNTATIVRPNSGYGVPNGSRPTHMDGRGVQRLN